MDVLRAAIEFQQAMIEVALFRTRNRLIGPHPTLQGLPPLRTYQMDNAIPITLQRLDDQIEWYDGKSQGAQTWFKILKIAQLVIAGAIPLVSVFGKEN